MFTILGALSNCLLRGGAIEALFFNYKNVSGMRYVNAILFGLASYVASKFNWAFGLEMAAAMALGQLWAIPHGSAVRGEIRPMFVRGLVWVAPIVAVMLLNHYNPIAYLPAALTMYLVYHGADVFYTHNKSTKLFNQVTTAELIYGALLWAPLDILFLCAYGVL